jgi:hypothetical protein
VNGSGAASLCNKVDSDHLSLSSLDLEGQLAETHLQLAAHGPAVNL